jgi:hypothetical protein
MTQKAKLILAAVLGLALAALAAQHIYERYRAEREAEQRLKLSDEARKKALEYAQRRQEEQRKTIQSLVGPADVSKWLEDGTAPFREILAKTNAKLAVLPPMNLEDKPGLDLTSRIVFARRLASGLAVASDTEVLDPALVFLALGEPRTLDEFRIRTVLGRSSSIEAFITGTVVVQDGRMTLQLRRFPVRAAQDAKFEVKDLPIGESGLPERALDAVVADARNAFGMNAAPLSPKPVGAAPPLRLPLSPLSAIETPSDPVSGIWIQQLLGALYSPSINAMPRPRERVFERSLSAVQNLPAGAADRAVLEARALLYLGRRQAAVRSVQAWRNTPEGEALHAYLVADLPRMDATVAKIRRPLPRLVAELELLTLRTYTGTATDEFRRAEAKRLSRSVPAPWAPIVSLFALSLDPWDYPSAFLVKGLLERDFAVPEYGSEQLLQGKAALGTSSFDARTEVELMLSPLVHVRKWRQQHAGRLCCSLELFSQPSLAQYLDLLENLADGLVVGRLHFLRQIQGTPDSMLAQAKLYDDLVLGGGHPGVLLEKNLALRALQMENRLAAAKESVEAELLDDARKILTWMPYQSYPTAWILAVWPELARPVAALRGYHGDIYKLRPGLDREPLTGDLPPRAVYLEVLSDGMFLVQEPVKTQVLRAACEASIVDFDPCQKYVQFLRVTEQRQELAHAVDNVIGARFNGYGARTELVARYLEEIGRKPQAREMLRAAVQTWPSQQQTYRVLAEMLRDDAEFEEATKIYLAYPRMDDERRNTVGLSNFLQPAARQLMRSGATEQSLRLTQIVAGYHDGSQSNLEAKVYAALRQNNGAEALQLMQGIYQRYRSPAALQHVASMLFLLGQREAAWSVLSTNLPGAGTFSPYRAVSVGLRVAGGGQAQALEWAQKLESRVSAWKTMAVFQFLSQDRPPQSVDAFLDVEAQIRGPVAGIAKSGNLREWEPPEGALAYRGLRAMALGYRDLLAGNHQDAAKSFYRLIEGVDQQGTVAGLYGTDSFWWALPYTAYALVKAGRAAEAAKLEEHFDTRSGRKAAELRRQQIQMPEFEKMMIKAIVAALSGNPTEGLQALRLAKARMPDGENRMIRPEYVFAEIAEWLAEDTGLTPYLQLAVDYAKAFQAYEPWAAWAYAFEARHTKDPARRLRAAALAVRLDPNSRRLQQVPEDIRQNAKTWLQRNPPFERPARPESRV